MRCALYQVPQPLICLHVCLFLQDGDILASNFSVDTQVAYILSLGVVKEFRKHGIGKGRRARGHATSAPPSLSSHFPCANDQPINVPRPPRPARTFSLLPHHQSMGLQPAPFAPTVRSLGNGPLSAHLPPHTTYVWSQSVLD